MRDLIIALKDTWEVFKYFGCDVRHKDGFAVFSASSPSPSNIVGGISAGVEVPPRK